MDLVLPWDPSTIATASDRAEMLRTERGTRIAEYLRPSFCLAAALEALRLSSSVRWLPGLRWPLIQPDFTPLER
jgi:hypothetical protein